MHRELRNEMKEAKDMFLLFQSRFDCDGYVVEKIDSPIPDHTHYYLVGKLKENLAPLPSELFSPQILPP